MAVTYNILVEGIRNLDQLGLSDVLLPFLLIFTILFAVLQKSKVLGTTKIGDKEIPMKNFNVMIALIVALLAVIPHVTMGTPDKYDAQLTGTFFPDVVEVINNALPQVSLVAVLIIMVMMLIGIAAPNINIAGSSLSGIVAFASFIVVTLIFLASAGLFGSYSMPPFFDFLNDDNTRGMIVVVLMFGLLIWFITKEPKAPSAAGTKEDSFFENLGKMLHAGNKGNTPPGG
jgi:hypothetical protein